MDMRALDQIKAMLCDELEEIARKGELTAGDLEAVHKLTDTIKNICKIHALDEGDYSQRGYSRAGDWNAHGTYGRGYGNSYGRHYVRGHYSRDDGMDMMTQRIEEMMDSGELSATEKRTLEKAMDVLRK